MTMTILGGVFYGIGLALGFLASPGHQDPVLARTVLFAYALGCGILGVIYGRFIENALKDPERTSIFYTDLALTFLGLFSAIFVTFPVGDSGDIPLVLPFLAAPFCVARLISISQELRARCSQNESCEQARPSVRHS
jgi:peptidoglycan/LPS O-acetylase OafA/YrhL